MQRNKYNVLYVDDDRENLMVFRETFRNDYRVLTASNGPEALAILQETWPIHLIVSDQRMPGMTGIELLEQALELRPNTERIILTAYTDVNDIIAAINRARVFQYVVKPWDESQLKLVMDRALQVYTLRKAVAEKQAQIEKSNAALNKANQRLKRNFFNTIEIFTGILELKDALLGSHSKRVAEYAAQLAVKLNFRGEELEQVIVAALLHDIGAIGIPAEIMERCEIKPDIRVTPKERELYELHPVLGESCLANLQDMDEVRAMVRSHHERYDGGGFPDGLSGYDIPMGSRIIAVCDAYDILANRIHADKPNRIDRAVAVITRQSEQIFDPSMVSTLVEVVDRIERRERPRRTIFVPKNDLREGFVVAAQVKTKQGRVVLGRNQAVTKPVLDKIRLFDALDPVPDQILIYVDSEQPAPAAMQFAGAATPPTSSLKAPKG